jgi:hypothetical protein
MYKLSFVAVALLATTVGVAEAQSLTVSYQDNLITVRCNNAALGEVFEEISQATGLELFLEDGVKAKRLTADIRGEPLYHAMERLLAGVGVNYAMMLDQDDWQRVAKIFIGEGGEPVASSQPASPVTTRRLPPRRGAPAADEAFADPYDETLDEPEEDFTDNGAPPGETDEAEDTDADDGTVEPDQPEDAGQSILPPPPSWSRSTVTPGLSPSSGSSTPQSQQPKTTSPSRPARPPAYYPFTDQFGRPIPVPQASDQTTGNDPDQQDQQEQDSTQ